MDLLKLIFFLNYTSSLYSLRDNIVTVRSIKPELIDLRSGIHRLVYIINHANKPICDLEAYEKARSLIEEFYEANKDEDEGVLRYRFDKFKNKLRKTIVYITGRYITNLFNLIFMTPSELKPITGIKERYENNEITYFDICNILFEDQIHPYEKWWYRGGNYNTILEKVHKADYETKEFIYYMLNPQEHVYPSNYHDASNFIKIDSPYSDYIDHIRKYSGRDLLLLFVLTLIL